MRASILVAAAAALAPVQAVHRGFNYAATNEDGSARIQSQFQEQFAAAKALTGLNGKFTSARLYTMIQSGTTDTPTEAIPAAIAEDTTLLLGLWASAGQADFTDEVNALKSAISQYGTSFTDLIAGISVGSEDLYRISPDGIAADEGTGAEPSTLVSYISQVRSAISGTGASAVKVGHVDTWTAWVNASNDAVISASDFLGMDAYPYYQTTDDNTIANADSLWHSAHSQTKAVADGKPVWVTETGWPVSGATEGDGVASTANAHTYWKEVACALISNDINVWWYILEDQGSSPSFGVVSSALGTTPLYSLAC